MKIIKAIKLDKYNNYKRYIQYGDFIYKDKKSRNNPVYCITLYTELEDDEDGQYPLEDILDEYYVNCTEVMEEIEEDKKRIFIFEIEGEDINSIAKKFLTKESVLMEINNIPFPDYFREGKEIIVPINKEKYFEYYTIKKGDSLYKIARENNVNPELLALLNGLDPDDYIYPNQEIMLPKNNYSYYVTAEGDTIDLILKKINVDKNTFMKQNETIYLMPGQLLVKKK